MDDLKFYRERFKAEAGLTRSVLERISATGLNYRPHPQAPSAGELFWTIVRGLQIRFDIATTRESDGLPASPHPSSQTMLATYGELTERLAEELGKIDEQQWAEQAQLRMNGRVALDWPVRDILWLFHFDVIHHRGQLTTYLRPMGAKVPSIYGKSGDDWAVAHDRVPIATTN